MWPLLLLWTDDEGCGMAFSQAHVESIMEEFKGKMMDYLNDNLKSQ
jgi:hypothetical protein